MREKTVVTREKTVVCHEKRVKEKALWIYIHKKEKTLACYGIGSGEKKKVRSTKALVIRNMMDIGEERERKENGNERNMVVVTRGEVIPKYSKHYLSLFSFLLLLWFPLFIKSLLLADLFNVFFYLWVCIWMF